MFEDLTERVGRHAERRARKRVLELTERMRVELPPGVRAEAAAEGVMLSGRGLRRRFVTDAALRWMRLR